MIRDKFFTCLAAVVALTCVLGARRTLSNSDPAGPSLRMAEKPGVSKLNAQFAQIPMSFVPNRGQWPDSILYQAIGSGSLFWFTRTGLYQQIAVPSQACVGASSASLDGCELLGRRQAPVQREVDVELIGTEFLNANPAVALAGDGELAWKSNYFYGETAAGWRTDVPNYLSLTFRQIYSGIDLTFSGREGHLACTVESGPGADLSQIRMRFKGASQVIGETEGTLRASTASGCVAQVAFTGASCKRVNDFTFGLGRRSEEAGASSESAAPTLVYSTFLGGSLQDDPQAIQVDDSGYAFVTGGTLSGDFPLQNQYLGHVGPVGTWNIFVTKLNKAGNGLVYSTYLGAIRYDRASDIAIDALGKAYVTGTCDTTGYPLVNAYQTYQGRVDAVVTKVGASGNTLEYSTYLGGSSFSEWGYCIDVDSAGQAYVAGETASSNFPTVNPYQTYMATALAYDVFVSKFNATGNALLYSTYLNGTLPSLANDRPTDIAVDDSGYAYVTGYTEATNFPTVNPYQTDQGGTDAFVTKLSVTGSSLVYSTYLGGSGGDIAEAIEVNDSGNVYVAGSTSSSNFPTFNPFMVDSGGVDGYVTKLNPAGTGLVYSTYIGVTGATGVGTEDISDMALDAAGNVHFTGLTQSFSYPQINSLQALYRGGGDAIVSTLNAAGSALTFSTFIGSSARDAGVGIALDGSGNIYVAGTTDSTNATAFPTVNPYQTDQGGTDGFVLKIGTASSCPIVSTGDINANSVINSSDIILLVNYVFKSGAEPMPCPAAGDINCNGVVNSADIILLVNYVFKSGPPPCDACTSSLAAACS